MSLENLLSIGSLIGDLAGVSSAAKAQKFQKQAFKQSQAQAQGQFDSQMDESVQRRVKDAQAAGIHPLFAMGASVGASPTISGGNAQPPSGSGMGAAISRLANNLGMVAQNRASAAKDIAETQLMDSERRLLEQELSSQGRDGIKTYPYGAKPGADISFQNGKFGPHEYYSPEVPYSSSPGVRAGQIPGTIEALMPDGKKVSLISPDLNMDEISQVDYVWQRAGHKLSDLKAAIAHVTRNRKGGPNYIAPIKTKRKYRQYYPASAAPPWSPTRRRY